MERNIIYNEDCIAGMSQIPDNSVDMILTDLPYGTTECRWDSLIPFDALWSQFLRVAKQNAEIVLTAVQPFTTQLIASQPKLFRYCWYWRKNMTTGFAFAKKQPLRCIEEICVFYRRAPTYNPQGIRYHEKPVLQRGKRTPAHGDSVYRQDGSLTHDTYQTVYHYPRQLLEINCERGLHPTQKPVALFEYLIRTYTNPGELVLDACIGSGTTAVACIRSARDYIGFELDRPMCDVARSRAENERI